MQGIFWCLWDNIFVLFNPSWETKIILFSRIFCLTHTPDTKCEWRKVGHTKIPYECPTATKRRKNSARRNFHSSSFIFWRKILQRKPNKQQEWGSKFWGSLRVSSGGEWRKLRDKHWVGVWIFEVALTQIYNDMLHKGQRGLQLIQNFKKFIFKVNF